MHYVYLLKSLNSDFIYVGSTQDLKKRFEQHNKKTEISTKTHAPYKLVYYEAYQSKKDALIREKKLKHHGSVIGHLKKRVENSFLE